MSVAPSPSILQAIIPARAGSKGIPNKNLVELAGKPLILHTIEAACSAKSLAVTPIVSTDSPEIAQLSEQYGALVPGLRPKNLASDDASALSVLKHMVEELDKGPEATPNAILYLQPTSPLRTSEDIDRACEIFCKSEADVLVSVSRVPHNFHPEKLLQLTAEGQATPFVKEAAPSLNRQDEKPLYARNGPAILIARTEYILSCKELYEGSIIAYEMPTERSIDIDSEWDLFLAEKILNR